MRRKNKKECQIGFDRYIYKELQQRYMVIRMPYIKQELRPPFDQMVELAKDDKNIFMCRNNIVFEVEGLQLKYQDGCLNYVFSQLFRKVDLEVAELISSLTICELFTNEPSYYNLSRAIALLTNMIDEFNRRGWMTGPINLKLQKMLKEVKAIRDPYEDEKIEQNGDLK